jgi:Cysteine-rich secretory protein family
MRSLLAAMAAGVALLAFGGGTAAAEGCLHQDEAVTGSNQARAERSLLCLANAVRVRSGLAALAADPRLNTAARAHSADMVARGYFSHTTPEGSDPSDRAAAAGYSPFVGENIAAASRGTAISVFSLWRASPGHNANLLGSYSATGLGVAPGYPDGGRGITATQMFGRAPAQGKDTGLDLYYPNEGCAAAKLRKIAVKARLRATRKARRAKLRRKLRRAKRAVSRTCRSPAEAPLL